MMNLLNKLKKYITPYNIIVFFIIFVGIILRLLVFDKQGGDYTTYKEAMDLFHKGYNPYNKTISSFGVGGGEHGYAYFPTLLYIQYFLWLISNWSGIIISTVILWKIPVLIADLLILFLILKSSSNKDKDDRFGLTKIFTGYELLKIIICIFWLFNPYLISRYDYSLYDPLFLLCLLLSLKFNEKNSTLSGVFYALSVSLKTIPIIVLPILLLKTPRKMNFILSCIFVFITISIPFMGNKYDFLNYIDGSILVHSERQLQGRPILTWISYNTSSIGINFLQTDYTSIYSMTALFASFAIPFLLYIFKIIKNTNTYILISFAIYLLLTPVLSRTHTLWLLPWSLAYILDRYSPKKVLKLSVILLTVWFLIFFYLLDWNRGFEPASDEDKKPILNNQNTEWELKRILRHKYYEFRS